MVFSSNVFLFLFLPITLGGYFLLPRLALKNSWLLIASLFFYFWGEPRAILVMLLSITINYSFGIFLHLGRGLALPYRRLILALAVVCNLGLLVWFKYLDFFIETINSIFSSGIPLQQIALPIGISFFTFQGMTYVIDLYRGKASVQKNPLKIALYISLFPQLIAGPIVRYVDVANQIDERSTSALRFRDGIARFSIGLAKKVLIANEVAAVADQVFAFPYGEITQLTSWLGILCYTLQIYFDFSGYSDMAIGLGKMFGFDFKENFDYPYASKSITEFWRRWHISLSSFFRDYLYIPLGGNRKGNVYFHLLIVFLCTGLWHGASWNFIVWGLWHGLFILIERFFRNRKILPNNPIGSLLRRIYTLSVVVIGWVFFRAQDLAHALGYLKMMFGLVQPQRIMYSASWYLSGFLVFVLALGCLVSFPVFPRIKRSILSRNREGIAIPLIQTALVTCLLVLCCVMVLNAGYNPFIYFRF